jgi:uncharacterized membrane protein YeaQ/YmgE (transglycosylase-associated protein family)
MMKRAIKDIFLLITGTLLGVLSTLLFETPIRLTLTIIIGIISVLLASYGLSLFDIFYHYVIKLLRNVRTYFPQVKITIFRHFPILSISMSSVPLIAPVDQESVLEAQR